MTLLDAVRDATGVAVDRDSGGGRLLAGLTPRPDGGTADGSLAFALTPGGVVPAAPGGDLLVVQLPGPFTYRIVPGGPATVEIVLVAPVIPLPFLRPAGPGATVLHLPDLLLVVPVVVDAVARLVPAGGGDVVEGRLEPPLAYAGPPPVLGLEMPVVRLRPAAAMLEVDSAVLHVAPPGVPGLALTGGVSGLTIGLGAGATGVSGDLRVSTVDGAQAPQRPRFVRSVAAHARLERGVLTLLEVSGQADLGGEVAAQLGRPVAAGILDYRMRIVLAAGAWQATLTLSGGGGAFLWRGTSHVDALGAYAVFAPLIAPALPAADGSGLVPLALTAGAAAGLAAGDIVRVRTVTLFGGELVAGGDRAVLLLDVETEFEIVVPGVLRTRQPLKVRQRAVGLRLDFATPVLQPVFDPGRGFTLDLSDPGTFEIPGTLGQILQGDGTRTTRNNPLNLEVDLAPKADLGVVRIDRASVRIPLLPAGPPSLTGLGAHLEAGPVRGSGHLQITPAGLRGGLDVSLGPIGVRARAALRVEGDAVLAAFQVEWPVPIPLGSSGVGLFGIVGLLGVNIERAEAAGGALQWYLNSGGDPENGAWQPRRGGWALGLGAVIGTLEGGYLINAKGMLMLELPGPRLLLMMKADMLSAGRPPTRGAELGRLLAILEITPDSLTIGVVATYEIPWLSQVTVPAEAFFDFRQPQRWHLDIGALPGAPPPMVPASVTFMNILKADGYLLLHGDGIPDFPLRPLTGVAVAAGLRAALTWGPVEIGLYVRVAVSADLGIGFQPVVLIGRVALSGELHLFIVGIGVSASARFMATADAFFVDATVCGEVDFFFFSIRECVSLSLGDDTLRPPPAGPLVRAVSLHSRTPALLPGSGADAGVDGSLGEAADGPGEVPVVPIDAIPVLEFEMRPYVAPGCAALGTAVPSLLAEKGWVRRGERFHRYTLRSVDLSGPVVGEDRPVVWWDRGGDTVQLALLTWIPDPTPAAAERTVTRDQEIVRRFGTICDPVAGPAAVLWSFAGRDAGPSAAGWTLRGIPWPDEPGTTRSQPPDLLLGVSEDWRTGDALTDLTTAVTPAYVLAGPAPAARVLVAPAPRRLPMAARLPGDRVSLGADGFREIRLLLFRRDVSTLMLRGRDSAGNLTAEVRVDDIGRGVGTLADLPGGWTDPARPWAATVTGVYDGWFQMYETIGAPPLVYAEMSFDDATTRLEIGMDPDSEDEDPHWGLLLAEGTTGAETRRADFDGGRRKTRISEVSGALHHDDGKRALLAPGTDYTLTATYDVETAQADDKGVPQPDSAPVRGLTQTFAFRTDDRPPARLDPWVLATSPSDGETAVFTGRPIRIVFATNAVRALFHAYGQSLRAVVQAASGRHPGAADLDAVATPIALPAVAETPFIGALRDATSGLDCLPLAGGGVAHEVITLDLPLEPRTEHLLDVQATPGTFLLRRTFTTSRYASPEALAAAVDASGVGHRALTPGASLARLTGAAGRLADAELELGLREARWGDLSRPREPRVTVVWQGAQPVAVVIETPEPVWRDRSLPQLGADQRYALVPVPWLTATATSPVTRLVRSTDGARTVAVLEPGARGRTAEVFLIQAASRLLDGTDTPPPPVRLVRAPLTAPPWEH